MQWRARRTKSATSSPMFMEQVGSPAMGLSECLIALEAPHGKMRIQWKGPTAPSLGRTEPCVVGADMIQITPQMRVLVVIEAGDGRKGIDSSISCARRNCRPILSRAAVYVLIGGDHQVPAGVPR